MDVVCHNSKVSTGLSSSGSTYGRAMKTYCIMWKNQNCIISMVQRVSLVHYISSHSTDGWLICLQWQLWGIHIRVKRIICISNLAMLDVGSLRVSWKTCLKRAHIEHYMSCGNEEIADSYLVRLKAASIIAMRNVGSL